MKFLYAFLCILFISMAAQTATLMPYSDNFEGNDSTCWAARPNVDENSAGCDGRTNIGKGTASVAILREGRFGIYHSSPNAVRIAYDTNEQESRFRFNGINSDSVFIAFWCYIVSPYDCAFGEKFVRAFSTDSVGGGGCDPGSLYWDHIGYMRNCGTQTSGIDSMCSFTLEPNGGSGDFGSATVRFPQNQWFFFQVMFHNNTPGGSDGSAWCEINGTRIINSTGLSNMRTSNRGPCTYNPNTNNTLITQVSGGGWWSNNPPTNPAVLSVKYEDDYCVQASKCPMSGVTRPWWKLWHYGMYGGFRWFGGSF